MKTNTTIVGNVQTWARDFGLVGLATGGAAPFFVIGDATFSVAAGLTAGLTGLLFGLLAQKGTERFRSSVPLVVMVATMTVLGALWGGTAGAVGGLFSGPAGSQSVTLGFILGGCSGMVQMAVFYPLYLLLSVRRDPSLLAVVTAFVMAPMLGYLALLALAASTFGLWLFVLPAVAWLAVSVDRSERQAKARVASSSAKQVRGVREVAQH